mgnify:FL=1
MVLNKKHKQKIPVYVTENDIKNSKILRLAYLNNIISQVKYQKIIEDNDLVLDSQYMTEILKNFFGFDDGLYEEHFIEGSQVTRVTKEVVVGVKRYCGVERVDDGWIESGLASQEAKEINKFGELLHI